MTLLRYLIAVSLFCAASMLRPAMAASPAEEWAKGGMFFSWQSSLPENKDRPVKVFYVCVGDETKPSMLLVHGFPTSSFDFRPLMADLGQDYRVCTFDFPGYGISDKPAAPYRYALGEDARLVWDFVTKIVPMKAFILFSHDRGDSVALNFLQLYQAASPAPFKISHQVLTNANMYLPLANLTDFQKVMLNPATSAAAVQRTTPEALAVGMGATQYTPPLPPDDPEIRGLAYNFAAQNGVAVIPATIQYLNERKQFEVAFLDALAKSDVPVTLIWGLHDMVSPLRVADHVWSAALNGRAAPASYWIAPCANHYLVHDQPKDLAAILRSELGQAPKTAPQNLTSEACSPVLVRRR